MSFFDPTGPMRLVAQLQQNAKEFKMFGNGKENPRHFTPPAGEKIPANGLGPAPTTKRVDIPAGCVEVVKYRFGEIVSCQEAMGVLASISGQKKRALWDYLKKQMPGVDFAKAQIGFDEKEIPFVEIYS